MLNRPATKIDLCLEEELNEYEQMKEYRIKHKESFESQFSKLINYPLDDNTNPSKYISSSSYNNSSAFAALQQTPNSNESSSNIKNYYNQPKEFNLSNVLFSGDSSSKKLPNPNMDANISNPYIKQFHTPDNK